MVDKVDAHSRLLHSRLGRVGVLAAVAVMAVWTVGPNLPPGPAVDQFGALWSPATDAGFDQNWSVFSPNPRDQSLSVDALVEFADGSTVTWTTPDPDPIGWRTARWRKWVERIRLDTNERLWDATAGWIAEQNRRGDELPITVRLNRRWIDHEPLTADGAVDGEPRSFEFYVWRRDA